MADDNKVTPAVTGFEEPAGGLDFSHIGGVVRRFVADVKHVATVDPDKPQHIREAGTPLDPEPVDVPTQPWPAPPRTKPAPIRTGPVDLGVHNDLVESEARRQNLDPDLVRRMVHRESAGHPGAVSSRGAVGLMQLMPGTAAALGVKNLSDPAENVRGGTRYLRQLLDRYDGDREAALAAYNWGPGKVSRVIAAHGDDWLAHVPGQVRRYVTELLAPAAAKPATVKTDAAAAATPAAQPAATLAARITRALQDRLPTPAELEHVRRDVVELADLPAQVYDKVREKIISAVPNIRGPRAPISPRDLAEFLLPRGATREELASGEVPTLGIIPLGPPGVKGFAAGTRAAVTEATLAPMAEPGPDFGAIPGHREHRWSLVRRPELEEHGGQLQYDIVDPGGKNTGAILSGYRSDPETVNVAYIGHETNPDFAPGPRALRDVFDQLKSEHPEVKNIRWTRTSGARADNVGTITTPLRARTAEPLKEPAAPGTPRESTAGLTPAQVDAVRAGGGVPGGAQTGVPGDELVLFHDPRTGSTLTLPAAEATADGVTKLIAESRARFKPGGAEPLKEPALPGGRIATAVDPVKFPAPLLKMARDLKISDIYLATQADGANGMNVGRHWYRAMADEFGERAARDVVVNTVNEMEGLRPDDVVRIADHVIAGRGDVILVNPRLAPAVSKGTATHEVAHTLTYQELGRDIDKPVGREKVRQLLEDTSVARNPRFRNIRYNIEADPTGRIAQWLSSGREYYTEVMTQYFGGNLIADSPSRKLAEAILRTSKEPWVRDLVGVSFALALGAKLHEASRATAPAANFDEIPGHVAR